MKFNQIIQKLLNESEFKLEDLHIGDIIMMKSANPSLNHKLAIIVNMFERDIHVCTKKSPRGFYIALREIDQIIMHNGSEETLHDLSGEGGSNYLNI